MNDKTSNFIGYSRTLGNLGLTSGNTTFTTNSNGISGTYDLDNNWSVPLNVWSNGTNLTSISTIVNPNNMNVRQVKVAVFTVERNEDNKVTSTKFIKELWVEVKNGSSVELAVAKELDKDFDPSTTVIKEIFSVMF
ncbi:MAG TPA: hypothetical protein PKC87_00895 [Candidatus Absconditabacterales bacterium]|nr:hypothetical protein [Candidatus Absconditabacterales bacterium]